MVELELTEVGELHSLTDWQVSEASEDAELEDFCHAQRPVSRATRDVCREGREEIWLCSWLWGQAAGSPEQRTPPGLDAPTRVKFLQAAQAPGWGGESDRNTHTDPDKLCELIEFDKEAQRFEEESFT